MKKSATNNKTITVFDNKTMNNIPLGFYWIAHKGRVEMCELCHIHGDFRAFCFIRGTGCYMTECIKWAVHIIKPEIN